MDKRLGNMDTFEQHCTLHCTCMRSIWSALHIILPLFDRSIKSSQGKSISGKIGELCNNHLSNKIHRNFRMFVYEGEIIF